MLARAMDYFQLQKAKHIENVKAQYTDKKIKDFFRASELGNLRKYKRKLIYGFFGHRLAGQKSAHNLRQLENGDYVHDRYQNNWKLMGILCLRNQKQSMEIKVSSKDDPWLSKYPWLTEGHYDGELDLNLVRAYALGKVRVESVYRDGRWVIDPILDFDYGREIGYFTEDGSWNPDYQPIPLATDIKTMNPYQFRDVKNGALEPIEGYIDQISFYMYSLNTPYGCIFIENKANNELLEVQIVWKDLRGGQYDFIDELHGAEGEDPRVMRVYTDNARFEELIQLIDEAWKLRNQLLEADERGDYETVAKLLPSRCASNPNSFPCKWSSGQCDFYTHCWSQTHSGNTLWTEPSSEEVWEVDGVRIDSRKVPKGVTPETFHRWLTEAGEELSKYTVPDYGRIKDQFEYDEDFANISSKKAKEYRTEDGQRAFECVRCGKEVTFKRLVGTAKKCNHCGHVNVVDVQ